MVLAYELVGRGASDTEQSGGGGQVEEFVADWLLKSKGWPASSERFVKVYFADELNIPYPAGKSLKDFLP